MSAPVLVAHTVSEHSGWGRSSYKLFDALSQLDPTIAAISLDSQSLLLQKLYPLADSASKPMRAALSARFFRKQMAQSSLIHCLTEPMIPLAYQLSQRYTLPLFLTLHGTYSIKPLRGAAASCYQMAYRAAKSICVPSSYTAAALSEQMPEVAARIRVIPWGIDRRSETVPGYLERKPMALFVGEIKPRKGLLELLRAFQELKNRNAVPTLCIVGAIKDTDYYQQLLDTIAQLGLQAMVTWHGAVTDAELTSLYKSSRVTVLPSVRINDSFEGFGLVHLEGFSYGTPSIGSLESGSSSAINHGKNGFLVDPRNTEELTHALEKLLFNESVWEKLSRGSLEYNRTWHDVAHEYNNVYRDQLSSSLSSSLGDSAESTLIPA